MDKLILFYEIGVISISKYYLCKLQRAARQQILFIYPDIVAKSLFICINH